jgi:protein TonB
MSHALYIHSLHHIPTGMRRGGLFGFVTLMHVLFLVSLASLAKTPVRPVDDVFIMAEMLPLGLGKPELPPGPLPPAQSPAPPTPQPEPQPEPEPQPLPQPVILPPPPPVIPKKPPEKPRPAPVRKPVPVVKPVQPSPLAITEPSPSGPFSSEPENAAPMASGAAPAATSARESSAPSGGAPAAPGGGGGESLARFDADYLRNPAPPYPAMSRRLREQGKVFLRVRVTPEGAAGDLEIKTSSGSARLDESALRTVRHWRFIPARRGGAAVASWVVVPIIFKLE